MSRNSTASKVKLLVTARGVKSFRGVDVQLLVDRTNGDPGYTYADVYPLPAAWLLQDTSVAGATNYVPRSGGFNGGTAGVFPSIVKAPPAMSTWLWTQGGWMYTRSTIPCIFPREAGVLWFSAAGNLGHERDPAVEYGVFGFDLDLSGTNGALAGDIHSPMPILIFPSWFLPCGSGTKGSAIAVLDSLGGRDYLPFEFGYSYLRWHGELNVPVIPTTWGKLRRLYE